jgi:hypothetical protein
MKFYIKLDSGHLLTLDDLLDERNWSPRTRKVMSWAAAFGIFLLFLLLIMVTP